MRLCEYEDLGTDRRDPGCRLGCRFKFKRVLLRDVWKRDKRFYIYLSS